MLYVNAQEVHVRPTLAPLGPGNPITPGCPRAPIGPGGPGRPSSPAAPWDTHTGGAGHTGGSGYKHHNTGGWGASQDKP